MRKIIFTLLVLIYSVPIFSQNEETTTFYFIRHAEKDRSNKEDRNPSLTQDGLSRALKWAEVFKNIKFDAVYATPYNRTEHNKQHPLLPIKIN